MNAVTCCRTVSASANDPMMPIAWVKSYTGEKGKSSRVFATTMGASQDLESEGLRRLLVNACYWAIGLDDKISGQSNVELVGAFKPRRFGFGTFTKGVKPADLVMP